MSGMYYLLSSEAPNIQSIFSTALDSIKGDVMGFIGVALPVALAIVAAFFGIKKAIAFFKSTAK